MTDVPRRTFLQAATVAGTALVSGRRAGAETVLESVLNDAQIPRPAGSLFTVVIANGAITSLKRANDAIPSEYIAVGRRLGDVIVKYRRGSAAWSTADTGKLADVRTTSDTKDGAGHSATYQVANAGAADLTLKISLTVQEKVLGWSITVENPTNAPIEIGDLAIPLPISSSFKPTPTTNITILKHSFISGHGSFIFWQRSNNVGPYLMLTPAADTSLEYWESGGGAAAGGYRAFIHSKAAGEAATVQGGRWRQPFTSHMLAPKGKAGDSKTWEFMINWADGHEAVRQMLYDSRQIDVNLAPGMTVPTDLAAKFSLRTKEKIVAIDAEFPAATKITTLGKKGEHQIYEARFSKLGENRLTVRYGSGKHLYLEFFATEPLETVIKKRAAFLAKCQHKDPGKWYNGLISEWNMETQVLLGPDNYDQIKGWRIYEVSCDDPGLGKPAYLAAKNAEYPLQSEVEALDYYINHFVWGGLQRSTDEKYSYGIYGIPDWKQNRDSKDATSKGQLHIWRPYDYPHIMVLYLSMYRVATNHPQIKTAMTAAQYLDRAYGTAVGMFTIPLEIDKWSPYNTGFYNERVIPEIIAALEQSQQNAKADTLRGYWEKKVKTFVNDKPDLFASEYAFDSTGFESTHALAKYALEHPDKPGSFGIPAANAKQFMEGQMAANIFCRGSIEPAYYYLGSDYRGGGGNGYVLTYMSQMGGWAVLDYALNYASKPDSYLRLGYASYLSAWALVNSGTAESNYGYWYPGKGNDGGAGGGFEPASSGMTWLGQPHHRGSWFYGCEIDLGFCGALRTAMTVVADDPIFGRMAFGGDLKIVRTGEKSLSDRLEIIPRDGLRKRLHASLGNEKLHLELTSDRFAPGKPIKLYADLAEIEFQLESDNPEAHVAELKLSLSNGSWSGTVDGKQIGKSPVLSGERTIKLSIPAGAGTKTVHLISRVSS